MKTEKELIEEANGILRSFYSIIDRKGETTNWQGLKEKVGKVLADQHEYMYPKKTCKHEFVKTTGKKSKKVTYYCLHCLETREEEVRPVSKEFKIKK